MTYCPVCGHFSPKNDQHCSCDVIAICLFRETEGRLGNEGPEMLPVTTANHLCGYCNKVFAPEVKTCPNCQRETSPLTESYLQGNVILLCGMATAKVWDPEP